jgi:hypothetical protein
MPSHAGNNVVKSCCDLAVMQCRYCVMLVIMLLSHAGDDAAEASLLRRDVDAESC